MSQKKPDYNWDGKRLDDLIIRTNSARRHVAEVSGISETKLQNYILNATKPNIDTLIKLADFFAVPLDYLCGRCDEETANDILKHYHATYEKIRVKDYEDCLFKRRNGAITIPQGYMAPWPYNLLDDIFCKPFDHPLTDDEKQALANALSSLTEREHDVIINYYQNDLTLEEVGYIYGVHRERIRQIVAKALRKLRHPSRSNPILYGVEGNKAREEYSQKLFEVQQREKALEQKEKTFSYLINKAELTDELKLITDYTKIHNDEAVHEPGGYRPSEAFLSLDLSVRAYNVLLRAGIDTVSSIIKAIRDDSIYRVRNLGARTVEEIVDKVSDHIGYDVRTLPKPVGSEKCI